MITHMVSFKYKAHVDAGVRDDHRRRLLALADIDGVLDLKVGADFVRAARSYDAGLVIAFPNRAALESYQKHPRHIPVAQFGVDHCDSIVAVDFES